MVKELTVIVDVAAGSAESDVDIAVAVREGSRHFLTWLNSVPSEDIAKLVRGLRRLRHR